MIGQHLILRCVKGLYDQSMSPGFKTAAVSQSLRELPVENQKGLDQIIHSHACFPDISMPRNTENGRGILRLYQVGGTLFATRSFRVHDLCDTGGTVSFVHTFTATEQERAFLLRYPQSMVVRSAYDDYNDVSSRTGGLRSNNAVPVNETLVMPDTLLVGSPEDVLEQCGFNEKNFATFIAAVCQHISAGGWTALIIQGVNEQMWDSDGGSELGEKLLAQLLYLLPDCVARFYSGVSYWNENPFDDCISDFKVRILSGRYTNNLEDMGISLFDLQSGKINCSYTKGILGQYLWSVRNDDHAIEEFHRFFTKVFGTNVDRILKLPELMDSLTVLYLNRQIFEEDNTDIHIDDAQINEMQQTVASLIKLIGISLEMFPELYEILTRVIICIISRIKEYSEEMETAAVSLLMDDRDNRLTATHSALTAIVLRNIQKGKASKETVDFAIYKITETDDEIFHKYFKSMILQLSHNAHHKPKLQNLNLLCAVYEAHSCTEYHKTLSVILHNSYDLYNKDNDYNVCVKIYLTLLRNINSDEELIEICDRIKSFIDYANKYDKRLKEDIVSTLKQQIEKRRNNDIMVVELGKVLFGTDTNTKLILDIDLFPLFIQVLPHAIMSDKKYLKDIWEKQYSVVLQQMSCTPFIDSEQFLENYTGRLKGSSLYIIEKLKIKNVDGFHSDWEHLNNILNCFDNKEDLFYGYSYIVRLLYFNDDVTRSSLIEQISDTELIYLLYVFSYVYSKEDNPEYKQYDVINTFIANRIYHDRYALDKTLNAIESLQMQKHRADIYLNLWKIQNNVKGNDLYERILKTENTLRNKPYANEIMNCYAAYFSGFINDPEKIVKLTPDIISFIKRGLQLYGWNNCIKLKEPSRFVIDLCNMIDTWEVSREAEYIQYFINLLNQYIDNSLDKECVRICFERIKNTIKTNEILSQQAGNDYFIEKNSLLGITWLVTAERSGGSHCNSYLSFIRGNSPVWNDSAYVLYGMKFLLMLQNTQKTRRFMDSFIDTQAAKISQAFYEKEKSTIIGERYQRLYKDDIQPHIDQPYQETLFRAAKKTGDQDIISIYKVRFNFGTGTSGGKVGNMSVLKSIVFALVITLILSLLIFLLFIINSTAGLIVGVIVVFLLAVANIVIFIILRKRRKNGDEK